MSNHNGYFQRACKKRLITRQADLDAHDFKVAAIASAGSGGTFNIAVTLDNTDLFGDVASFTQTGAATLYTDVAAESVTATDAGPNTTGAPAHIAVAFTGITSTSGIVGNTWKVVFASVVVICKDGSSKTIASVVKTFPSPL